MMDSVNARTGRFKESLRDNCKGMLYILLSSVFVATGQLLWKLWPGQLEQPQFIILGMLLYAAGALLMVYAFRFGSFSVLHPLLTFSYVLSLLLGYAILHEVISIGKIAGVAFILIGVILIGGGDR